jgi:hypothetical protein
MFGLVFLNRKRAPTVRAVFKILLPSKALIVQSSVEKIPMTRWIVIVAVNCICRTNRRRPSLD